MPAKVNRLLDVSSVLRSQNARTTKLESFPASGMTLLQQVSGDGIGGLGYYNAGGGNFEYMAGSYVPQATFTLIRPQPILVMGEIGGFYGSGGTASYVVVRLAIMANSTDTVGTTDIHGNVMESGHSYQTNGSGIANAFASKCWTVGAGTYYVGWGYTMQGGAATTFTLLTNSIQVFAISG